LTPFWLFKSLYHIPDPLKPQAQLQEKGERKNKMDSSAKRKVGAIALIVAGIGAFLVPFLLHSPALQASSNNGGNTRTPTGSTCTTNCTTPSGDTGSTTCTDPKSSDSSHDNEGKHLAKGHDKQDNSIASKAQGFMAALGKHNPQHEATHSTKTDNHTVKNHTLHSNGHDTDDGNTCADNKDNDDSDDQGNDD
jgi:hypothetical protein